MTEEVKTETVEAKKTINETLEVLEAVKVLAKGVKTVISDGKVNVMDLPVLIQLVTNFAAFQKALENAKDIPAEMKDIDAQEAEILVAKVFEFTKIFIG